MIRLITAGLLRRRWQTLATIAGVSLGVALLFAALLLRQSLQRGLELSRQKLGADLLVVPGRATVDPDRALFAGSPLNVYMDRKALASIGRIPGVRRFEAQFFTQTLRLECCSVDTEIRLVGIENDVVSRLAGMSREGVPTLQPDEVIVGGRLMSGIGKRGSLVELLGKIFKVGFRLEPTATSLDYSILLPIDSARKLAAQSEALQSLWRQVGTPENLISAVLIEVQSEEQIGAVATALEGVGDVRVVRAGETFQRFKKMSDGFTAILWAACVLALAGGAVYFFSHIVTRVWDRKGEWALYRVLGATPRRLIVLVLGEAATLGQAGVVVGLPLGLAIFRGSLALLSAQGAFPIFVPDWPATAALTVFPALFYLILSVGAALLPVLRVIQAEPALTVARGDVD